MSQSFNVSVDEKKTQVFVGSGEKTKDNKVTIKIVSKTVTTKIKKLAVKVDVGDGETALVSAATGLTLVAVVSPPVGEDPSESLEISSNQPDVFSYSWSIDYGRRGFDVDATDGLVLTLTGIVSETDPGSAKVELAFDLTGDAEDSAKVAIQKQQEEKRFEIVKFTATPTYLSSSGGKVTLSWSVNQATRVELRRDGGVLTNPDENNTKKTGFEDYPPKDGENRYLLVAKRNGQSDITREMIVRKEKPGWISLDYSGSYGEPSTLFGELTFGTDSTPSMAAIFIKDDQARLYRSQSGTGVWLDTASVPAGMETSPGVVFDKKLWLLGGSAVSPDQRSDRIWCYTTIDGWQEWNPEERRFSPRMGHACVVFDEKLWMMGGFDENGNAQNDVWQLANGKWWDTTTDTWPGRCMFGAASTGKGIYVFGGAEQPFGSGFDDVYLFDRSAECWVKQPKPQANTKKYALASAVGTLGSDLYVVATFLKVSDRYPYFGKFDQRQEQFDELKGAVPPIERWGDPYSASAIEFRGRLFLRALADCPRNKKCRLHVYVPN